MPPVSRAAGTQAEENRAEPMEEKSQPMGSRCGRDDRGLSSGPTVLLRWLCAWRLERFCVPLLVGSIRGTRRFPGRPAVLCLERQNFSKDIEQLRGRTSLDWLTLRHKLCGQIQSVWAPARMRQQMLYYRESGADIDRALARSRRFFARFLTAARRRHGIGAVLSANTDYWQDEAIRWACRDVGLPFLVLSREHYITAAFAAERMRRYRDSGFHFNGTAVAVFGPQTADTMRLTGICPPEHITVTGAPRLDVWREFRADATRGDDAVLLSFARPQYGAPACFADVLRAFARAAQDSPGRNFVVKCKNEEDRGLVNRLLPGLPGADRLRLVLGTPLLELLGQASAVIGFNSLALLEALLAPPRICVPLWSDAGARPENLMFPQDDVAIRAVIDFARAPEDLGTWLRSRAQDPPTSVARAQRMALLQRYFHFPQETTCSAEVEQFVLRHLPSQEHRGPR